MGYGTQLRKRVAKRLSRLIFQLSIKKILIGGQILLFIVPVLIVIFYSYASIEKSVLDQFQKSQTGTMNKIDDALRQNFNNYKYILRMVSTDPLILKSLQNKLTDETDQFIQNKQIREQSEYYLLTSPINTDVMNMKFYLPQESGWTDGSRIFVLDKEEEKKWLDNNWVSGSKPDFFIEKIYTKGSKYYTKSLSSIVRLRNFNGIKTLGYLRLDIYADSINKLLGKFNNNSDQQIYITDKNFDVLFSSGSKKEVNKVEYGNRLGIMENSASGSISRITEGEHKYIVSSNFVGVEDFILIIELPFEKVSESVANARAGTAIIIIAATLLYMVLIVIFSSLFSRRIQKLVKKMKSAETGELNVSSVIEGNDEISYLDKTFNEMLKKLDKLIYEKYVTELDRNRLKLDMLQEQMNPHFVCNSLEAISAMASLQGCDDVEMYVKKLGLILRYNITIDNDVIVPFRNEVSHMLKYTAIQRIRFKNKFDIKFYLKSGTGNIRVLKFIMQPLIENSIDHGFKEKAGKGIIKVFASWKKGRCNITVYDNGIGIDPDRLDRISEGLENNERKLDDSIAILNVNARLKLYYGEDSGVKVFSKPGRYTVVILDFPVSNDREQVKRKIYKLITELPVNVNKQVSDVIESNCT